MTSKLTSMQTYSLMLICLLGTAIIFGTPKVVPDVWLVELLSILPAIPLFLMYSILFSIQAKNGFLGLLVMAWGKYLGNAFAICYAVYFLYIAARNVRDMVELVMTALLRVTPTQIVVLLFVILIAYTAYGGIKTLGRLSEIIVVLVVLLFIILSLLLAMSGSLVPERVLPFLSKGFGPIVKECFIATLWFPYGELIVFLMLNPGTGSPVIFKKMGLAAIVTAGTILTLSDLFQVLSLGMEIQKFSAFPLLDAARLIKVGDFISRMDALVSMITILSVLMKCSVFLYASVKGVSYVFRNVSLNYIYPFGLLIGALSLMVSHNFAEHGKEGLTYVIFMLHIPLQFIIPLLTGIVIWVRAKRKGSLLYGKR
ncbi:GerAB/ArcD/ProY family transporter [Paenibacillus sp. UNC451MF]|uniref:GerAB/ArcD/ProY family transporter n=1 Tax=Paenibacillus sp. UNC451MF TaxID=1449063 RepID=UPI000491457D|nr:GerAB/ArcD/ProY family transporter [Paenibacillus sp. UNC451MF]